MGDGNGSPVVGLRVGEPGRDPTDEIKNSLAAVRRGGGVAQPGGDGLRLPRGDLGQSAAGPASVVTLAQRRLDACIQAQRFGGLPGPQFRTGPALVDARQMPGKLCGQRPAAIIKRLVAGKCRSAHGIGRSVADQNEARGHRALLSLGAYIR
jgi:hypothetical protein